MNDRAGLDALSDHVSVLVGRVGEQQVAIPVQYVLEVLPRVFLNTIPESPQYFAGYLQWRGVSVPVIDPAARCGQPPLPVRLEDRIVVLSLPEGLGALLLSEVDELASFSKSQLTVATAEIPAAQYALASCQTGENRILLLDVLSLIDSADLARYAIR
jgi:chemotaxis signal transduction protein